MVAEIQENIITPGIKGWLLIPAVLLIWEAIRLAQLAIIMTYGIFTMLDKIPYPNIQNAIIYQAISYCLLLIFGIVALFQFFKKRKEAPALYIGICITMAFNYIIIKTWLVLAAVQDTGVNWFAFAADNIDIFGVTAFILSFGLSSVYMFFSKRVDVTFTTNWKPK